MDIKSLYYITHIDNLASILEKGILSHEQVEKTNISSVPVYDKEIVTVRQKKITPNRQSLWEYANLYFQPRNPMLYRVVHEKDKQNIIIIGISPNILKKEGSFITDGNAANDPTLFYSVSEGLKVIQDQWSIIQNEWWNDLDGSKRKIMAECLIPERIDPEYIHSVFVFDHKTKGKAEEIVQRCKRYNVFVVPEPYMFFQSKVIRRIDNIVLMDGDMLFSRAQTFTVSVNLQGIMGKGLASRTKYQFPDVYVRYQDVCRSKQITATRPYIYKREASLDQELADSSVPIPNQNSVKWFLLFATKRKWRENSRLDDIEGGLNWIKNNFQTEGIRSIALPALGCGLGNLEWAEVGPVMCQYLIGIGITVAIYLPREQKIDEQYTTESYLLKKY